MRADERTTWDWRIWPLWVIATGVGGAVGSALGLVLVDAFDTHALRIVTSTLIFGCIGLSIGAAQWVVLRPRIPRSGWWIPASAVCGIVIGAAGSATEELIHVSSVVAFGAFGLVLGTGQWLILRRQVHRSAWWIAAGPPCWMIGILLGGLLERLGLFGAMPELAGLVGSFGVITLLVGATSGAALAWLLGSRPHAAV